MKTNIGLKHTKGALARLPRSLAAGAEEKMMIETKRLILREYTLEDFDAIHEILSDPETMRHYPKPFDEKRTRSWIEWNLQNYQEYGFGLWAVVWKETLELIVKEYPNKKDGISYAYAITREEWEERSSAEASG